MSDNKLDIISAVQIESGAVTVNGIEISEFAIEEESKNYPGEKTRDRASAALVIRHLLLEEAGKNGIGLDQPDEKIIDDLLQKVVTMPSASEEVLQSYYEKNRDNFRSSDLYEVSHILFAASPDDLEAREKMRAIAEEVIRQVVADSSRFAQLATEHSACPSKEMGGNLGQITYGSTVPEFERKLFTLPEGLHEQPLETRYGYHVVRVDRRVSGKQLPFEMVRESIASHLYRHSQKQLVGEYIDHLVKAARVTGVDMQSLRKAGN